MTTGPARGTPPPFAAAVVALALAAAAVLAAAPAPAQEAGPGTAGAVAQDGGGHVRPVPGAVLRPFDPPPEPWLPGHRGVDLAAAPGAPVRASAAGRVHFAGSVAGRPTVSVMHADGLRTTYQPVEPSVRVGDAVARGQVIGTLAAGPEPGLHWGALRGDDYVNPLDLLGRRPVILKPARPG
ncbi:murein hydrolase activator EnvC family protein [Corynebacterium sp. 335C]